MYIHHCTSLSLSIGTRRVWHCCTREVWNDIGYLTLLHWYERGVAWYVCMDTVSTGKEVETDLLER